LSTEPTAGADRPSRRTTMIDAPIHLPEAPPIPGLVFRPFDPDRDYPGFVDLVREANLADGIDWVPTVENLRNDHGPSAEFDPRRALLLAEVDGRIVAAGQTGVRTRDGIGSHSVDGWVSRSWRRRGLGASLLAWTERRAAEVARVDGRPPDRV